MIPLIKKIPASVRLTIHIKRVYNGFDEYLKATDWPDKHIVRPYGCSTFRFKLQKP